MNTKCEDVREEFSALLDGELTDGERESVEGHLAGCSDCLRELDGLKRVDGLYRELPDLRAPEGMEEAVREALQPKVARLPSARYRGRVIGLLLAAASVIIVAGGLLTTVVEAPLRLASNESSEFGDTASLAEGIVLSSPAPEEEFTVVGRMIGGEASGALLDSEQAQRFAEPVFTKADDSNIDRKANLPVQPPAAPVSRSRALAQTEVAADKDSFAEGLAADAIAPSKEPVPQRAQKKIASAKTEGENKRSSGSRETVRDERDDVQTAMANEDLAFTGRAGQAQAAATDMLLSQDRLVLRNVPQEKRKEAFRDEAGSVSGAGEATERVNLAKTREKTEAASPASELEEIPILARSVIALKASSDSVPRTFTVKDGVWYESGYDGSKPLDLTRDSKSLRDLIQKDGDIARFLEWEGAVVFRAGATWYRLAPTDR